MLMELSTIPVGDGASMSDEIADAVAIIDKSGLDYRVTSTGTIVEGELDALLDLARRCHTELRGRSERVMTLIRLDDYDGKTGRIDASVDSVEKKVGKSIRKCA